MCTFYCSESFLEMLRRYLGRGKCLGISGDLSSQSIFVKIVVIEMKLFLNEIGTTVVA